jgi:hypothetical protein
MKIVLQPIEPAESCPTTGAPVMAAEAWENGSKKTQTCKEKTGETNALAYSKNHNMLGHYFVSTLYIFRLFMDHLCFPLCLVRVPNL